MARRTQDFNAFRLFRSAFGTTLTADGSAWIGSHTLLGGGTTNNQILTADVTGASSTALTTASLNVAQRRLASMKSHANVPLQCVGNLLLVPTALYIVARQVTGSALIPENGNNAINPFTTDYAIRVYQSVFLGSESPDGLGSDTAWFLMDTSRHAIRRLVRQGIQTNLRDWGMSNDRTYYYQANFREEVFVPDYVGVVGAKGDTA